MKQFVRLFLAMAFCCVFTNPAWGVIGLPVIEEETPEQIECIPPPLSPEEERIMEEEEEDEAYYRMKMEEDKAYYRMKMEDDYPGSRLMRAKADENIKSGKISSDSSFDFEPPNFPKWIETKMIASSPGGGAFTISVSMGKIEISCSSAEELPISVKFFETQKTFYISMGKLPIEVEIVYSDDGVQATARSKPHLFLGMLEMGKKNSIRIQIGNYQALSGDWTIPGSSSGGDEESPVDDTTPSIEGVIRDLQTLSNL